MSDFPVITIRNDDDVSLLAYHLNKGEKVGFTIPMDVSRVECWRLMDLVFDRSRECRESVEYAEAA